MNRLLTAKEVGERLGIDYSTVHLYVKQGKIKPVILRGGKRRTVRFEPEEVQQFINRCKHESLKKKIRKLLGK